MIIIENDDLEIDNFHKRLEKTKNNIYLCENKKLISNNEVNNDCDKYIEQKNKKNISITNNNSYDIRYNLNELVLQNKREKINRVLQKIEYMDINRYNENYYKKYDKYNKKKNKIIKKEYEKVMVNFKKIYDKSLRKSKRISNKRLLNYKKLI